MFEHLLSLIDKPVLACTVVLSIGYVLVGSRLYNLNQISSLCGSEIIEKSTEFVYVHFPMTTVEG